MSKKDVAIGIPAFHAIETIKDTNCAKTLSLNFQNNPEAILLFKNSFSLLSSSLKQFFM